MYHLSVEAEVDSENHKLKINTRKKSPNSHQFFSINIIRTKFSQTHDTIMIRIRQQLSDIVFKNKRGKRWWKTNLTHRIPLHGTVVMVQWSN